MILHDWNPGRGENERDPKSSSLTKPCSTQVVPSIFQQVLRLLRASGFHIKSLGMRVTRIADRIGFHLRVSRVWMNQRMSKPLLYPQPIGLIGTGWNFAGDSHLIYSKVVCWCRLQAAADVSKSQPKNIWDVPGQNHDIRIWRIGTNLCHLCHLMST